MLTEGVVQVLNRKSFVKSDEDEIENKKCIGQKHYVFEVLSLVTQVHEDKNDVCCFNQGENDEQQLDGFPGKGAIALEVYAHEDFEYGKYGKDTGYHIQFFANLLAFFLTVFSVE
jgi:hypothetical protein